MVANRHEHQREKMTVEDFLALDRENLDQKYEFIDGEMIAMAGGSTNHSLIITNLTGILYAHLRKKPCKALAETTLKIEDECYLQNSAQKAPVF